HRHRPLAGVRAGPRGGLRGAPPGDQHGRGQGTHRSGHADRDRGRRLYRRASIPAMNLTDPRDRRPQRIAIIPGDGIGKDVTVEAVKVPEAAAEAWELPLELIHFPYSADHYLATGETLPAGA